MHIQDPGPHTSHVAPAFGSGRWTQRRLRLWLCEGWGEGGDYAVGFDAYVGEAAQVADQLEGVVGPGVPAVGVVGDARSPVVLELELVDGPLEG